MLACVLHDAPIIHKYVYYKGSRRVMLLCSTACLRWDMQSRKSKSFTDDSHREPETLHSHRLIHDSLRYTAVRLLRKYVVFT